MPYLSAAETDQLSLPSNAEFWVKMKRRASYGDGEAAKGAIVKISRTAPVAKNGRQAQAGAVVTEAEVSAYNTMLTSRVVVEWNLTDSTDHVMAITPENV